MVDKEKLQYKIKLQKTKNIVSKIEGIQVIDFEEQSLFDEDNMAECEYIAAAYKLRNDQIGFKLEDLTK